MNLRDLPREAWIAVLVLFILAMGFDPGFFVLLFLAGLLYLARSMMENNSAVGQPPVVRTRGQERQQRRQMQREPVYEEGYYEDDEYTYEPARPALEPTDHAIEAVKNAGHNPNSLQVMPVDLGLLSFTGNETPVIHQVAPVSDEVDYVQPYVQLKVPRNARGRIRFEILDQGGDVIYVHEDNYQLQKGKNLIVPSTRMPVHDNYDMEGRWSLRISADNLLIASHTFEWEDTAAVRAGIRAHIEEDGEISNELRDALAENRLQKMSLDELLSFQDDDDQQISQKR